MILHLVSKLNRKKLILASASPRRLEILRSVGLEVEVVKSTFEESLDKAAMTAGQYAEATASCKAKEVCEREPDADLVIAGDTVVEIDGEVLEKPSDGAHAIAMLSRLRGREHMVHTGVALAVPAPRGSMASASVLSFHETTRVTFTEVSDDEVAAYVATGECFDKAGSYGVQGPAAMWVSGIKGCYFNVMGFPVHRFAAALSGMVKDGTVPL